MVAGVSGGLARYFEIHPAVFRVGFVVLTLLGGAGILIYAAAALVMPDEGKDDSIATAALRNRRDRPWPLIGLGLARRRRRRPAVAGHAVARGDSWCALPDRGRRDPLDHAPAGLDRREPRRTQPRRDGARGRTPARVRRVFAVASRSRSQRWSRWCSSPSRPSSRSSTSTSSHGVGDRTYVVTTAETCRATYQLGIGIARSLDLRGSSSPSARRTSTPASTSATCA